MAQTIIISAEPSNNPARVISVAKERGPCVCSLNLSPGMVLVEFLAAPINPQDLLVLEGLYPVRPAHHHNGQPIPGYDGVCSVLRVAEGAAPDTPMQLQVGDHAVPRRHGLGTWRSHAVIHATDLIKIPAGLDTIPASMLKMSVLPAYLLLTSAAPLQPGDWIVQNAAGGVIAQMVAQFAKMKGCRVLSIIRDRVIADGRTETATLMKQALLATGTDLVLTESELEAYNGSAPDALKGKRVVLALDAVFGRSGQRLVSLLSPGATYVNYGSLGGADTQLPLTQKDLFWKEVTFKNFRLSNALATLSEGQLQDLLGWFADCFMGGKLVVPEVDKVDLRSCEDLEATVCAAVRRASEKGIVGVKKQVFVF